MECPEKFEFSVIPTYKKNETNILTITKENLEIMSVKTKILNELKEIFWVSLYFFMWFAALMLIKVLLLREYKIEAYGVSVVIIGTLIAAKAVIILGKVPLLKNKPAWIEIFFRTLLYLAGIFVLLLLEKGFEARHEYGSFFEAILNTLKSTDEYHIWVNTLCVLGALFFFNLGSIVKLHLGKSGFLMVLRSTVPDKKE